MGANCQHPLSVDDVETDEIVDRRASIGAAPVVAKIPRGTLEKVRAEELQLENLLNLLSDVCKDGADREVEIKTLTQVVRFLAAGMGGMIVAVVHEEVLKQKLCFDYLDGGLHTGIFQQLIPNIHDKAEEFQILLEALTAHSDTDRWEHASLERLAKAFPDAAPLIGQLEAQPKDGGIILCHRGTIHGVALHLKYQSDKYQLVKADDSACGTRHASSLGLAEWLGGQDKRYPSVVFARSDGGGAHAFVPRRAQSPRVCAFETLHPMSQKEMMGMFKDVVLSKGTRYQKTQMALARKGVIGERVVTLVNGKITSDQVVEKESMVIMANTPDQELYVLPQKKFGQVYEMQGHSLSVSWASSLACTDNVKFMVDMSSHYIAKGFKMYGPKPGSSERWIYTLSEEDIEKIGARCFVTEWGAVQGVRAGDLLAVPSPEERATEIYVFNPEALKGYEVVEKQDPDSQVSNDRVRRQSVQHFTQTEMLKLFKDRIMKDGRLVVKTTMVFARPGVVGEQICTCIMGRVLGDTAVQEEGCMVIRAPIHQELYVLSGEQFEQLYNPVGKDLEDSDGISLMLKAQGFKIFSPKATNRKWLLCLTDEDIVKIPNGLFFARWGAIQYVQVGDMLAMPAPEEKATEIYKLPLEECTCFSEVGKSATGR